MDWGTILPIGLPLLLGIGFVWKKIEKVLKAFAELSEALVTISSALQDKNLTPEEIVVIKKEISEAVAAFKAILSK